MLTTIHRRTASLAAAALFAATALAPAAPALARTDYVQDGAQLFSQGTDSRLDSEIGAFNRSTGKEIVIVTAPSLGGKSIRDAAEQTFSQQRVNGVLFYLAKAEKQDVVVPDRAAAAFFPSGTLQNVHQAMRGYFRGGDYDAGITTGVGLVLDQYRSHERAGAGARDRELAPTTRSSFGGGMSLFWLILMLVVGFLVIRAIFRAISGRRVPPGYGGPGGYNQGGPPGYGGGPGYGGPGYGGYQGGMQGPMGGGMGRGGGFMSGLLGGLGGAFIGNELFGRHDGGMLGGDQAGFGGDQGSSVDNSGFQNDAGQADMGNAGGGGWGDSGGGGGDFGGGGGDGGGGW